MCIASALQIRASLLKMFVAATLDRFGVVAPLQGVTVIFELDQLILMRMHSMIV
jgi:hypothetical protein